MHVYDRICCCLHAVDYNFIRSLARARDAMPFMLYSNVFLFYSKYCYRVAHATTYLAHLVLLYCSAVEVYFVHYCQRFGVIAVRARHTSTR